MPIRPILFAFDSAIPPTFHLFPLFPPLFLRFLLPLPSLHFPGLGYRSPVGERDAGGRFGREAGGNIEKRRRQCEDRLQPRTRLRRHGEIDKTNVACIWCIVFPPKYNLVQFSFIHPRPPALFVSYPPNIFYFTSPVFPFMILPFHSFWHSRNYVFTRRIFFCSSCA